MRAPFFFCLLFITYLLPNSAWSERVYTKDRPHMGSLERMSNIITCSYAEASLCRIWSRIDNAQEFHDFIKICHKDKSPLDLLRDTRCDSSLHSDKYRKQFLMHLLVSDRGTFATIFMDLAKHFRKSGKTDDFAMLLNMKDERGLRFLDYLDMTHPTEDRTKPMGNLRGREVKRIKRYACLYGALYADEAKQPSDCKKSKHLVKKPK